MATNTILGIILGYFMGSIPFTQIVAKARKGIDLREVGSKNVGGMNTIHHLGLGWGLFAGAMDVLKGLLAIVFAQAIGAPEPSHLWAGLAAIAGHNWPVWLGFRGGKGIATAIGIGAYIAFPEMLIGFLVGVGIMLGTKNVVFAAFSGFVLATILMPYWGRPPEAPAIIWLSMLIMLIATLPSIIAVIRSPGGVKSWYQNPRQMYDKSDAEQEARDK